MTKVTYWVKQTRYFMAETVELPSRISSNDHQSVIDFLDNCFDDLDADLSQTENEITFEVEH